VLWSRIKLTQRHRAHAKRSEQGIVGTDGTITIAPH
jgi:hypothetical protein